MKDDPYITQAQLDRLVALEHRALKAGIAGLGPLLDLVAGEIERAVAEAKSGAKETPCFSLTCGIDGTAVVEQGRVPAHRDPAADAVHEAQCRVYWDLLCPSDKDLLGITAFEEYRRSIPPIPAELMADDPDFPLLVLVEPRLGFYRLCDIAGISRYTSEAYLMPYDAAHQEFASPAWIRVQDGKKNRWLPITECREHRFGANELGLTVLQGVCTVLLHRATIWRPNDDSHCMDLPGTVETANPAIAVSIGTDTRTGDSKVFWRNVGQALVAHGSASRRLH